MATFYLLIVVCFFLIVAVSRWKIHPFLVLLCAGMAMGFGSGLRAETVMTSLTQGFGNTLTSIGIVIGCGTIIGTFLERSGAAESLSAAVLRVTGERNAPLAMSISGFIVSIPVFCDSGFVILSSLNKALSKRTGVSLSVLAVALSTGLYATHVLVPPTPGPLAAAGTLGADLGLVILFGLLVAVPTAAAGWLWARFFCQGSRVVAERTPSVENGRTPAILSSVAPLLIPIVLISASSLVRSPVNPFDDGPWVIVVEFMGHPVVALLLGVLAAFGLKGRNSAATTMSWVADSLKEAGSIILITGAGGALGNVLRVTNMSEAVAALLSSYHVGIFLPFIIAAILKTAQGSSTVSMITTAAIILPLLEPLGFASPTGRVMMTLAVGAGSMVASHLNDSYFWVVSQFSNMDASIALRTHTVGTLIQGVIGIVTIYVLSCLIL